MGSKFTWLTWLTIVLLALAGIAGALSGARSERRHMRRLMRRGEISVGAAGLIALALIGGLTLGIYVGEKGTLARHALDIAELQANNAALVEEVAAYRATFAALGIGPRLGNREGKSKIRTLGMERKPKPGEED
jgi:uncharacterized protein YneF (UPF0154 family)